MRRMKRAILAIALVLGLVVQVHAHEVPYIPWQSTAIEGSHIAPGTILAALTVTWHSQAARWVMVFDGTSIPSNGATSTCTSAQASQCLLYCAYIQNSGSQADGSAFFGNDIFPLRARNGLAIAISTNSAGCGTLAVDGSNDWLFGQSR